MDSIVKFFADQGLDFWNIITICLVLLLGTLIISLLARLIFGRRSTLNSAVSSAIGILFIFTLTLVIHVFASAYEKYLPPLPFAGLAGDKLLLFPFLGAEYTSVSSQLLSMILLAFGVNLIDGWMPEGRNIFSWLFFRVLTVGLSVILHSLVVHLFVGLLPAGLVTYSPVILLAILILMLLTGALKFLVGLLVSTVSPIIGAFYTFFFANVVGKAITKAVLTTGLLALLVVVMEKCGVYVVHVNPSALMAYIPFGVVLVLMWRMVRRS